MLTPFPQHYKYHHFRNAGPGKRRVLLALPLAVPRKSQESLNPSGCGKTRWLPAQFPSTCLPPPKLWGTSFAALRAEVGNNRCGKKKTANSTWEITSSVISLPSQTIFPVLHEEFTHWCNVSWYLTPTLPPPQQQKSLRAAGDREGSAAWETHLPHPAVAGVAAAGAPPFTRAMISTSKRLFPRKSRKQLLL